MHPTSNTEWTPVVDLTHIAYNRDTPVYLASVFSLSWDTSGLSLVSRVIFIFDVLIGCPSFWFWPQERGTYAWYQGAFLVGWRSIGLRISYVLCWLQVVLRPLGFDFKFSPHLMATCVGILSVVSWWCVASRLFVPSLWWWLGVSGVLCCVWVGGGLISSFMCLKILVVRWFYMSFLGWGYSTACLLRLVRFS